jgi:hypothetical protein
MQCDEFVHTVNDFDVPEHGAADVSVDVQQHKRPGNMRAEPQAEQR